ncbi:MAG: membrane dipeptidase [Myxococcota bacterium]
MSVSAGTVTLRGAALDYVDHREDPQAWADALGVSRAAVDLYLASDVVDLHTDTFLWTRVVPGYDVRRRGRPLLPNTPVANQADLPRVREAALTGIVWDIVTNPWRDYGSKDEVTLANIKEIVDTLAHYPDEYTVCRTASEYDRAKARGTTASFISMQGGNGLARSLDSHDKLPAELVHRITVVHMTPSKIGWPNSSPVTADKPLTEFGRSFVQKMQDKRILVDLSHINRGGFWDALAVTDSTIPPIVTHTGLSGVKPLWRNIDDAQVCAIAERGGTVGIVFNTYFLAGVFSARVADLVRHIVHGVKVAGEDHVSLGSDYDGGIWLPRDLPDITYQPRIVQEMLDQGLTERQCQKVLGENFLRVLREVRP